MEKEKKYKPDFLRLPPDNIKPDVPYTMEELVGHASGEQELGRSQCPRCRKTGRKIVDGKFICSWCGGYKQ